MAIDEARTPFVRHDDGPVVELDLGEQAVGARPRPARGARRRFERRPVMGPSLPLPQELLRRWRRWRPVAAAALAGALLGGAVVHVADTAGERGNAALTIALGKGGGDVITRRFDDRRVVLLRAVAVNEGGSVLTLQGVRVEGAGASAIRSWRGQPAVYPLTVEPGQTRDLPLAVLSDCTVRATDVPRVLVDLTHEDGTNDTVEVTIPGMRGLWEEATADAACSTT